MKRIACAEELLKNGASVVEAAEQSGFRDSGGFIRTFKRYRGITPGQLKTVKNQGK
jgi:two-component system response regulator YesN